MKNQESKEIELDVVSLFKTLWRRKFSILSTALIFALAALGYSTFVAKKTYQSTSRIYVVSRQNQENNALTNQDLQAGSYLVKDYREMTPGELSKKISVAVPTDTRILSITASDADPKEAARIANGLKDVAAEKIIAVTKVSDVTTLDEAVVPQNPSSPNIKRNVLLGFVVGGVLISALVILSEVLDDRVKKPEDVEEVMGVTLIGVIPSIKKL